MADVADTAHELGELHLQASLARVSAAIPAGIAGECEECGEDMPRLVDGRCGYCRDGRRPPLSRFDAPLPPRPVPPPPSPPAKEKTMPAYKNGKYLNVPADGALLRRIEAIAAANDLSVAAACQRLLDEALTDRAAAEAATGDPHDGSTVAIAAWLEQVPNQLLAAEISRRMGEGVSQGEYDAAAARADAAEATLAKVRASLGIAA